MDQTSSEQSLSGILSSLQVNVIIASVQTVDSDWKRENYVHSFNRMYYIIDGAGRIEVDGSTYYPQPGQLVIMPCHVRQSYAAFPSQPFHKYWCHFTARVGSQDLFEMYRFPVCLDVKDRQHIEGLFQRMITAYERSGPASILNAHAAMMELIGCFIEHGLGNSLTLPTPTHKMNRVLEFMEQHLEEKMTVEQLAGLVHYHPNYFIRAFRSVFGCSPIQFINRLRLEKARQLLMSDMLIGDIARAVGIEPHNFSTMFKHYTGFSPREFRRLQQ